MEKTVILPGMWGDVESAEIDEPQMSYGVVTHREGYRKVVFSGAAFPEGDVAEQIRGVLEHKRRAIQDLGGSMADVTTLRIYVREDVFSEETQVTIHEVRAEFFENPHYPAATMVGVSALHGDDALVEVDVEAEIPDGDWDTTVVTGE